MGEKGEMEAGVETMSLENDTGCNVISLSDVVMAHADMGVVVVVLAIALRLFTLPRRPVNQDMRDIQLLLLLLLLMLLLLPPPPSTSTLPMLAPDPFSVLFKAEMKDPDALDVTWVVDMGIAIVFVELNLQANTPAAVDGEIKGAWTVFISVTMVALLALIRVLLLAVMLVVMSDGRLTRRRCDKRDVGFSVESGGVRSGFVVLSVGVVGTLCAIWGKESEMMEEQEEEETGIGSSCQWTPTDPKASLNLSFDTETLKLISARNCFSISETSAVVNRDWRPPVVAEVEVDETESFVMGGVGQ